MGSCTSTTIVTDVAILKRDPAAQPGDARLAGDTVSHTPESTCGFESSSRIQQLAPSHMLRKGHVFLPISKFSFDNPLQSTAASQRHHSAFSSPSHWTTAATDHSFLPGSVQIPSQHRSHASTNTAYAPSATASKLSVRIPRSTEYKEMFSLALSNLDTSVDIEFKTHLSPRHKQAGKDLTSRRSSSPPLVLSTLKKPFNCQHCGRSFELEVNRDTHFFCDAHFYNDEEIQLDPLSELFA